MSGAELEEAPSTVGPEPEAGYEFDEEFQTKIVALTLRDTTFCTQTYGLIEPAYFEREVDSALIAVALSFFETYKKAPDKASLGPILKRAIETKKIRKDLIEDVKVRLKEVLTTDISDRDLVVDEVAEFAKNKAVEGAMIASVDALARKDYEKIRKLMETALLVGKASDGGAYDYWAEIENRTKERIDLAAGVIKKDGITTGHEELDKLLYHGGWGRKEIAVILGAAKAGKSMSLGEFAKNASLAGYNVYYGSCEVSAKIIAERTDANVAETAIRALKDTPHKVKEAVQKAGAKAGKLVIDEFASGTLKVSQLRRILERWRMKGVVFDLIVVDYADIMAPERKNEQERDNLREIYVDLRAVAFDYNVAMLTATQTNREGAKGAIAKATDVAEDFSKVRTADIMLSINATPAEVAAGEARIYFAAVRNGEAGFSLAIRQDRSCMKFISKIIGRV